MNLRESNEILRKAIIKIFFEPKLLELDYKISDIKHPIISDYGLTNDKTLHLFFDLKIGNDYPDGDEWFSVEYLFPYHIKLPDNLKGPDFFTTISIGEGKHYWRHRELIRFKYGKSKKLLESLEFINKRYKELSGSLNDPSILDQIK